MQADAVRVQALDETWETLGADRRRGVLPELRSLAANRWGSDRAGFDLRRLTGAVWPDIGAFTPVEIDVAGRKVWAGRVAETPSKRNDRLVSVQCEGWQYHLDDDAYARIYAHAKLADWRDQRSFLGAALVRGNGFPTGPTVVTDDGVISFGWPMGIPYEAGSAVGVTLDLGPENLAKRVVVEWDTQNLAGNGAFTFYARAHATEAAHPDPTGAPSDAITLDFAVAAASGTTAGTFSTGYRYVSLFLYLDTGTGTTANDHLFRVKAAKVFTDDAYESGDASVLKASTVVKDARNRGTILLSPTDEKIVETAFAIDDFAPDGYRTPREMISAADAYHDWLKQVDLERRLVYQPQPVSPLIELGAWPGSDFEDASANSGEDIYNRAIIEAEGPDGQTLRVSRRQPTNVNEVTVVSSPAPTSSSLGPAVTITGGFTGTFRAGVAYAFSFDLVAGGLSDFHATLGGADFAVYSDLSDVGASRHTIVWTPASTYTSGVSFSAEAGYALTADNFTVGIVAATLADRRGFQKTKIVQSKAALTTTGANQIGDTFLAAHKTTPLKGKVTVTEQGGARDILTGQRLHPAHLLPLCGQKLRLSDQIDPDTGGLGRDGYMANVNYDPATQKADIDVDAPRDRIETLLERLAVIQGR